MTWGAARPGKTRPRIRESDFIVRKDAGDPVRDPGGKMEKDKGIGDQEA